MSHLVYAIWIDKVTYFSMLEILSITIFFVFPNRFFSFSIFCFVAGKIPLLFNLNLSLLINVFMKYLLSDV